jgi:hypothetical protein
MPDLFRDFWWLAFPLSWFLIAGWRAWLSHRSRRDLLDLIATYERAGRDAPPELLAKLSNV